MARPTPFEAVVMAVLLEQEKALYEIRDRLERLEAAVGREQDADPGLAI